MVFSEMREEFILCMIFGNPSQMDQIIETFEIRVVAYDGFGLLRLQIGDVADRLNKGCP